MRPTQRSVWCDVQVHLELAEPFDPKRLSQIHSGLGDALAEVLIGSPRTARDRAELEPFRGLTSVQTSVSRLRLDPPVLHRLARALDAAFTALEFDIVGRRVLSVPGLGLSDWRAISPVWACLQPLKTVGIRD